MKTIVYNGSSKIIKRIVNLLNRKAPLPLDGQGDAEWGTSGQVLTTDGNGNTYWGEGGGGGDVTDVEVNGTSVVNAQGVAEVSVPTATSDLNNDSGFIDGTDLSTALSDYTPTSGLAAVATSGSYNDLSNKPTIPAAQVNSDWNAVSGVEQILNKPTLATVATSGSYNDLSNKPTIPAAQVNSDWNAVSGVAEILNKPTIPTALADLSEDTTHRVVTDTEKTTWNGKVSDNPTFTEAATRANIASGESFATILGKIKKFFTDLKTVAFTGAYSDLSGTPTIPTVNDGTLTIQKNGTTVQTFTANQSGNATANLQVVDAHVIENPTGTDMAQRANLQFADAHLTDDSVNGRTKVENVKAVDSTGWSNATEDGLYDVDDGGNYVPITGNEIGYDANTSLNQKIDEVDAKTANVAYKNINNNFTATQTVNGHLGVDNAGGTTTTVGTTYITVGNNKASGTDKNSRGAIQLFGDGTKYATLKASGVTSNRNLELPDKDGTIALEESVTTVTGITRNASFTSNYISCKRYGKFVELNADLKASSAVSTSSGMVLLSGLPKGVSGGVNTVGIIAILNQGTYSGRLYGTSFYVNQSISIQANAEVIVRLFYLGE